MSNRLTNIAIVGASGTVGTYATRSLLAAGKSITAITRSGTSTSFPSGVRVAPVSYDDPASLVAALKGHDALIITMSVTAPQDTETKLIDAAIEAGVKWILPNEWGYQYGEQAGKDVFFGPAKTATRKYIESKGGQWIGIACGFWYEFSLAGGVERYGFDLGKREVTLFDEGERSIGTSTWEMCGVAVARLLSLPVEKDGEGPALVDWRNGHCRFASFTVSQRDMWESLVRVTGTKEGDWKVSKVPVGEFYQEGLKQMQGGDRVGFAKCLYSRMFFEDNAGRQDLSYGLDNEKLDLPKEDLDEATKRAVGLYEEGWFQKQY
ncbi:hypothetical protein KVT40_008770 [Elsinoe batatas]|uniref:NmrA-like domain-containing protein n=1 Tax=Elsinoe batatas TaxID=2601811 RepID=A0A8K0KTX7_9PEZI|nr:hypothetical protein KVT40_008770 [Elsinoe batatas]